MKKRTDIICRKCQKNKTKDAQTIVNANANYWLADQKKMQFLQLWCLLLLVTLCCSTCSEKENFCSSSLATLNAIGVKRQHKSWANYIFNFSYLPPLLCTHRVGKHTLKNRIQAETFEWKRRKSTQQESGVITMELFSFPIYIYGQFSLCWRRKRSVPSMRLQLQWITRLALTKSTTCSITTNYLEKKRKEPPKTSAQLVFTEKLPSYFVYKNDATNWLIFSRLIFSFTKEDNTLLYFPSSAINSTSIWPLFHSIARPSVTQTVTISLIKCLIVCFSCSS